jgi:hypothetical protein
MYEPQRFQNHAASPHQWTTRNNTRHVTFSFLNPVPLNAARRLEKTEKIMKSKAQNFGKTLVRFAAVALLAICANASSAAAQDWTAHIDWAAQNTDAGGSVDCPDQYISNGVPWAIASGGRSAVINEALFAAYGQNFDRAFTLVLMTQCHNSDARQQLANAGEKPVLQYLVGNYQPTGPNVGQLLNNAQTIIQLIAALQ